MNIFIFIQSIFLFTSEKKYLTCQLSSFIDILHSFSAHQACCPCNKIENTKHALSYFVFGPIQKSLDFYIIFENLCSISSFKNLHPTKKWKNNFDFPYCPNSPKLEIYVGNFAREFSVICFTIKNMLWILVAFTQLSWEKLGQKRSLLDLFLQYRSTELFWKEFQMTFIVGFRIRINDMEFGS